MNTVRLVSAAKFVTEVHCTRFELTCTVQSQYIAQTDAALAVSKLKKATTQRLEKRIKRSLPSQTANPSQIIEQASFFEVVSVLKSCLKTNRRLSALNTCYTKRRRIYRPMGAEVKEEQKLRVDLAIELRNALAHPNWPWRITQLLPKEDLKAFISWLTALEGQLAEYLALGNKLED